MDEQPYKIFIVEDEPNIMELIKDTLEDENLQLFTAFTLKEARENLKKNRPDMVIMDRGLPDGDGLELCAEIRKDPQYQSVAVLMLTGQAETRDKVLGLNLGADDYVAKPFETIELKSRVNALRRRTEERAELRRLKQELEHLKAAHRSELEELAGKHQAQIEQIRADSAGGAVREYEEKILVLTKKHQDELASCAVAHQKELASVHLEVQSAADKKLIETKSGLMKQFDQDYTDQNNKFMAQINKLVEENEKFRNAKARLEEAAAKMETEVMRKSEEANNFEMLLTRKQKEYLAADAQASAARKKFEADISAADAQASAARKKFEADISSLGALKADFEQRCYPLEAEVKRRAADEAALTARLEALAAEKTAKETELAQAAQNLKTESDKRAGVESEVRSLKQKVQQLESQTGELAGRVEIEKRNLANAKDAAARNVQAAEAKVKELSAELEKYKKMKKSFGERVKWAFKSKKEGEEE